MMDIRLARRTARALAGEIVDNVPLDNQSLRNAFYALDRRTMQSKSNKDRADHLRLARIIWDHFGNLGTKGKETA